MKELGREPASVVGFPDTKPKPLPPSETFGCKLLQTCSSRLATNVISNLSPHYSWQCGWVWSISSEGMICFAELSTRLPSNGQRLQHMPLCQH